MFRHLLVPTDGSDLSRRTATHAITFARETGARPAGDQHQLFPVGKPRDLRILHRALFASAAGKGEGAARFPLPERGGRMSCLWRLKSVDKGQAARLLRRGGHLGRRQCSRCHRAARVDSNPCRRDRRLRPDRAWLRSA